MHNYHGQSLCRCSPRSKGACHAWLMAAWTASGCRFAPSVDLVAEVHSCQDLLMSHCLSLRLYWMTASSQRKNSIVKRRRFSSFLGAWMMEPLKIRRPHYLLARQSWHPSRRMFGMRTTRPDSLARRPQRHARHCRSSQPAHRISSIRHGDPTSGRRDESGRGAHRTTCPTPRRTFTGSLQGRNPPCHLHLPTLASRRRIIAPPPRRTSRAAAGASPTASTAARRRSNSTELSAPVISSRHLLLETGSLQGRWQT